MRVVTRLALVLGVVLGLALAGLPLLHRADAESQQEAFIRSLVPAAQKNQANTGIPASVAIGMAALETGWGRSSMAKEPVNTLFNIKCTAAVSPYQTGCHTVRTAEYKPDGTQYFINDSFRTYANTGDSVLDYGRLLTSLSRYQPAFAYTDDPDQFVREVRKGGYATDPKYADLVISIMKSYNLYQYDKGGRPNPGGGGGVPVAGGEKAEDWKPGAVPSGATAAKLPEFVAGADYPAYAMGMREPGVKVLQRLLNERNAAGLAVDGIFGKGSDAAVRNWQNKADQKATGVMDDPSWRALLPTLRAGSKGQGVVALQEELGQHGFKVAATGTFDAATTAAVKKFQDLHRMRPDGVVGPVLWARLLDW